MFQQLVIAAEIRIWVPEHKFIRFLEVKRSALVG